MQDLQKKTFQLPQTHNQQHQYQAPHFQPNQHSELQQFAFQRFLQHPSLRYSNSTSKMTAQTPLNNRHAFQGPRFPMPFPSISNNPSSFTRPIINCGIPQTNTLICNTQPHHSMHMNSSTSNVFLMNTFANQPAPLLLEKNYVTKFTNSSNIKGSNTNTVSNLNQSGNFSNRNVNVSSKFNCNFSNSEMFETNVPHCTETDTPDGTLGKSPTTVSENFNLKINDFSGNRMKPSSSTYHPRQQETYLSKFLVGASETYSEVNKYEAQKKKSFAPRNDESTTNKNRDFRGKVSDLMLNDNKSTFYSDQHSARPKVTPKTQQRENSTYYTRDHDSIRKRDSFMSVSQDQRNRTSKTLDKSSYSKREYRSSSHREMHAHSRSRLRSTSPINSRSSHKREKSFEHKNVPASLDFSLGSVSSQLSQYRQDLLKSEKNDKNDTASPQKRPKLDVGDHGSDEESATSDSINYFTRSCPADLYFIRNSETGNMEATSRMIELENKFESELVKRSLRFVGTQDTIEEPSHHLPTHHHHHHCTGNKSSCDSSSSSDEDDEDDAAVSQIMEEWDKRKKHPYSLHPELWYNLKGQVS